MDSALALWLSRRAGPPKLAFACERGKGPTPLPKAHARIDAASKKPAPAARPGRPPKSAAAPDLRERILDVAEAQFAKLGFEAVTTRGVAREAGATAAMIHYYFASKRQLFDAVFARRADVVNRERIAALDAYEKKHGARATVEGALEAFLDPVLRRLDKGGPGWRNYLALVAQVGNKHEWGGAVMTKSFDPVIQRLIDVIRTALPGARDEDLYWGYHFFGGALLLTLSETDRIDRLSKGKCRSTDIAAIKPRMIAFAASGFRRVCDGKKGKS
jgi:AcrR family transcriptional regulator